MDKNIEVVDKFNYLGVTLDSTGSWNKQKTLAKMKGYQALRATDKCIVVTTDIKVQMLKAESNAFPLQALTGPSDYRRSRLLECLDNRHMKEVSLSALRTGRKFRW
jgi:hypothetical protein